MTKYLLTIVFLWLLVMLFNAPIPGDILEKEWEFPNEINSSKHQQETKSRIQAFRLNVSPTSGILTQAKEPEAIQCCFPPKP